MANELSYSVDFSEVDQALTKLARVERRKTISKAMRIASKPLLAKVKEMAPVGNTGALKKSIKLRVGKRRPRNNPGVTYSVVTSDGWFKGDQFYAGMVEFGTKKMPAHPFMRPAADQMRESTYQLFRKEMKRLLAADIAMIRKQVR